MSRCRILGQALGVLISTFPDACVVHLHRDPLEVVPSSANIMIKSLEMTNTLDRDVVAELPQQIMDGFGRASKI